MTIEKPFFMSNKEWFYFDEDKMQYFLTEKATEKAKQKPSKPSSKTPRAINKIPPKTANIFAHFWQNSNKSFATDNVARNIIIKIGILNTIDHF